MKVTFLCLFSLLVSLVLPQTLSAQSHFLVVGDSKVLLVNYKKSTHDNVVIDWEWDASQDAQLPENYRKQKFKSMDDAKFSPDGKQLIVSSSSGGVAVMSYPAKKISFFTEVGNAHSIEFLPDGLIAVAGSVHPKGNSVEIYHPSLSDKPLAKDSLYSGHGVVWHPKRKLLYALGYDVLRAYKVTFDKTNAKVTLQKVSEWKIPGKSGHDLTLTPDAKYLLVTEHTNAWKFSLEEEKFSNIALFPTKENIKSIGFSKKGTILYTEPEQSWWTYHVKTINPEKSFPFPNMRVYKARWK